MIGLVLLPQPSPSPVLVTAVVFKGQVCAKNTFDLWLITVFVIKDSEYKKFLKGLKSVIFFLVHVSCLLLPQS